MSIPQGFGNPNQAWVTVTMRAGKNLSADPDAAALGNGCTPRQNRSAVIDGAPSDDQTAGESEPVRSS
jgi:hypothetical protein